MISNFKITDLSTDISSGYFSQQIVQRDFILNLLSLACYTNTACNTNTIEETNLSFILVDDLNLRDLLSTCIEAPELIRSAPSLLFLLGTDNEELSFRLGCLCSRLDSMGLLFIAPKLINHESIRKILKVSEEPKKNRILGVVALGYPIIPPELDGEKQLSKPELHYNLYSDNKLLSYK